MQTFWKAGPGLPHPCLWPGLGLPLLFLSGCAEFPSSFVGVVLIVQLAAKIKVTLTKEEKKKEQKGAGKASPSTGRAWPRAYPASRHQAERAMRIVKGAKSTRWRCETKPLNAKLSRTDAAENLSHWTPLSSSFGT